MELSVLLSSLNCDNRLAKAIDSCLISLPSDSELLVSIEEPRSNEFEQRFTDTRLKFFWSSTPRTLPIALNSLIAESKGRLIARIDSDDIARKKRFKTQVSFFKQYPELSFAFGSVIYLHEFGSLKFPIPAIPYSLSNRTLASLLTRKNPLAHPTMMCRRDAIVALGGYHDIKMEDYELWLRAIQSGLILHKFRNYAVYLSVHKNQKSKNEIVSHTDFERVYQDKNFPISSGTRLPTLSLSSSSCLDFLFKLLDSLSIFVINRIKN